jgi:hypothetical protein
MEPEGSSRRPPLASIVQFRPLSGVLRKRSFAGGVAEADMLKAAGCMAVSLRWRSE